MKIAWYVNLLLPPAAQAFGLKTQNGGGWLTAQAECLAGNERVELTVIALSAQIKQRKEAKINGIQYVVLPKMNARKNLLQEVLRLHADMVHVFGTEYSYNTNLIMDCAQARIRCVASLQGVMYQYAEHYDDGLPGRYSKINPLVGLMKKVYYADSIAMGKKAFFVQGEEEKRALKSLKYVIGRTAWDNSCALAVNPQIQYFHVNENLRAPFYEADLWSYERCVPHSLFVSQAFYPIKGFHRMLEIMPRLIERYPDIRIMVAGNKPYGFGVPFLDRIVDYFFEYQNYIKKKIRRTGLQEHIQWVGSLDAMGMVKQYLRCNLFVSCSTLENSPNSVGEAMMLGVPVVASRVGGTGDIMADNQQGKLYDFWDLEEMFQSICFMLDNPKRAEDLGEAARSRARKTHDREQNTAALLLVYERIMADD